MVSLGKIYLLYYLSYHNRNIIMTDGQLAVTLTIGQLKHLIREEVHRCNSNKAEAKEIADKPKTDDGTLTLADVARMLRCSRQTIHSHVKKGLLPKPFRIGRRLLWDRQTIDNIVKAS